MISHWLMRHLWLAGWCLLTALLVGLVLLEHGMPNLAALKQMLAPPAAPASGAPPGKRVIAVQISDPLHTLQKGDVVALLMPSGTPTPQAACNQSGSAGAAPSPSPAGSASAGPAPTTTACAPSPACLSANSTPAQTPAGGAVLSGVRIVALDETARLSTAPPTVVAARVAVPDGEADCDTLARFASAAAVYTVVTP